MHAIRYNALNSEDESAASADESGRTRKYLRILIPDLRADPWTCLFRWLDSLAPLVLRHKQAKRTNTLKRTRRASRTKGYGVMIADLPRAAPLCWINPEEFTKLPIKLRARYIKQNWKVHIENLMEEETRAKAPRTYQQARVLLPTSLTVGSEIVPLKDALADYQTKCKDGWWKMDYRDFVRTHCKIILKQYALPTEEEITHAEEAAQGELYLSEGDSGDDGMLSEGEDEDGDGDDDGDEDGDGDYDGDYDGDGDDDGGDEHDYA